MPSDSTPTTHLSVRLAWHDRAWDGHICDNPHLNTSCVFLKSIREDRDEHKEREHSGRPLNKIDFMPPCSRDTGAYGSVGYNTEHTPPDFRRKDVNSVSEFIPPYSSCTHPYRRMLEENFREICEIENLNIPPSNKVDKEKGWVSEPERQLPLLQNYWNKLEEKRSLIFYYVNQGNPLNDNDSRILVGIGRLKKLGDQIYYPDKTEQNRLFPVWSRCITQDYPNQGVRIPYQEYIEQGKQTDSILCRIPKNHSLNFLYVSEHISDDVALIAVENMIQSIKQVKEDNFVEGDWDDRLEWLNDILAELWLGRGAYPGIGALLSYLGSSKGYIYHKFGLSPLTQQNINIWEHLKAILDGTKEPENNEYKTDLIKARERWQLLPSQHKLLSTLVKFELSKDQIDRVITNEDRQKNGINATDEEIINNPYILCESDHGTFESSPIGLETIDHGMLPEIYVESTEKISSEDPKRVRATAKAVLDETAELGDSVLHLNELLQRIENQFTENRKCAPKKELFCGYEDFLNAILWTSFDAELPAVAIKHIKSLEEYIAEMVTRWSKKTYIDSGNIDWTSELKSEFDEPKNDAEKYALAEKEKALNTFLKQKLSVLTGGAGTGKTSVLKVFLKGLKKLEGHQNIKLLAPTGKARVRLSTATEQNAMTIHQMLLKAGWLHPDTFQLKHESNLDKEEIRTVIIDECSMISSDLFGTLLKALDENYISRIILVGDPNQLPPIGPGRPFVDIIEWLKENNKNCLANLSTTMRTTEGEKESKGLLLANSYRPSNPHPADDEILSDIAKQKAFNDLEVNFWKDSDDLMKKLNSALSRHLNFKDGDYKNFNKSLGITSNKPTGDFCEAWQILSPSRSQYYGTDDINRKIQKEYKGRLINKANWSEEKPFGDSQIIWTDKVMQNKNQSKKAWPRESRLNYVANGEIGIVTMAGKKDLDVSFSTQNNFSYKFSRGEVGKNLELAYALTVHKSQGSDFDIVFLIIPKECQILSRELIYTGLTRFSKKLVLLVEDNINSLLEFRHDTRSETASRNTYIFDLLIREEDEQKPYIKGLIHCTRNGTLVRSKSEVIVADILQSLKISYNYEKVLPSKDDPEKDFRYPDFTVAFDGEIWYWEHLGMLNNPSYREAWERKKEWYKSNGYFDRLIISEDAPDGSINAEEIERIARTKILGE